MFSLCYAYLASDVSLNQDYKLKKDYKMTKKDVRLAVW